MPHMCFAVLYVEYYTTRIIANAIFFPPGLGIAPALAALPRAPVL